VERLESELRRRFVLIPESDLNDPRLLWSRDRGGFQLDAQWSDDFHHALHAVLTGERNGYYSDFGGLSDLAGALQQAFVYAGKYSLHRQRIHGRSTEGLSGHRFLGYLQNHDQIGNRAKGERSGRLMNLGRLKIGAALILTSPFVPMIFQGEEWGASTPFLFFTDHQEPELAGAVRAGRCREFAAFGWKPEEVPDPQARETFEKSKLNWGESSRTPHAEMLAWHKKLIRLRQTEPDLTDGRMQDVQIRFDEQKHWLTLKRGAIRLACNLSALAQAVPLIADDHGTETARQVELPPDSVCIFKHDLQMA
jgi:maltooligosyltrehalose trehalohydrolase